MITVTKIIAKENKLIITIKVSNTRYFQEVALKQNDLFRFLGHMK